MSDDDVIFTPVFDHGTSSCRAGFAGEDSPKAIVPSVVGLYRNSGYISSTMKLTYIGEEAKLKRQFLDLKYPIDRGKITNWDHMVNIWHHLFYNELRVIPEECPLVLSEPTMNSTSDREKMTEIMFEYFDAPRLYLKDRAALSQIASRKSTGIVLISGEGVTYSVPVIEGYPLRRAILQMNLAGRDITDQMVTLLRSAKISPKPDAVIYAMAEKIKEDTCYVAQDIQEEMASSAGSMRSVHTLPNGESIRIDKERFRFTECMFDPGLLGSEECGIHEMIYNSLLKCAPDFHPEMFSNIVLSGGNTMIPGFAERLTKEMYKFAPKDTEINVIALPGRRNAAWLGGSVMGSRPSMEQMAITSQEYSECGPSIIHKKCPVSYVSHG